MEIEFNGISGENLQEICDRLNITSKILPLASRDPICPRKETRQFGDGESLYLVEESCWHGYFFCGGYNCGRSSYQPSRGPVSIQESPGIKPARGKSRSRCTHADCTGGSDCDASSDSAGALIIFILIIAIILLLIIAAPYLITGFFIALDIGLAILLFLFDLITFGIFRKKFKRVLVYFPEPPTETQLQQVIGDAATLGGLPRQFERQYGTNGFWILRTGAYLLIPSLVATILVLWLQPDSRVLFSVPIVALIFSIFFIWLGNLLISQKARKVASGTPLNV